MAQGSVFTADACDIGVVFDTQGAPLLMQPRLFQFEGRAPLRAGRAVAQLERINRPQV